MFVVIFIYLTNKLMKFLNNWNRKKLKIQSLKMNLKLKLYKIKIKKKCIRIKSSMIWLNMNMTPVTWMIPCKIMIYIINKKKLICFKGNHLHFLGWINQMHHNSTMIQKTILKIIRWITNSKNSFIIVIHKF